jgi:hypothetical protein
MKWDGEGLGGEFKRSERTNGDDQRMTFRQQTPVAACVVDASLLSLEPPLSSSPPTPLSIPPIEQGTTGVSMQLLPARSTCLHRLHEATAFIIIVQDDGKDEDHDEDEV